jgi:hypothetical protein
MDGLLESSRIIRDEDVAGCWESAESEIRIEQALDPVKKNCAI